MKASCSRADLVRLFGAPGTDLLASCAGLLGFEKREIKPEAPRPPATSLSKPSLSEVLPESKPVPAPPAARASYLQVVKATHHDMETVPRVHAPWEHGDRGDVLAFPAPDPLVPWPRLWRHLRRHLSELRATAEVDQAALVRRLGRAETVTHLPRLHRARFASRPKVLVDGTSRQMPFWHDQDVVCSRLARWTASDASKAFPLVDGDPVIERLATGWPGLPKPDFRGAMVLVLGDLGAYGGQRAREEWRQVAELLLKQGATLRALVPCPLWRVDRKLAALWNAIPWEASERRARPLTVAEREQRAGKLIELVSPALRIELGLLRRARSLLPPDETDSGTEVDALYHPGVVGFSAVALSLDPTHKQQLEKKLDESARKDGWEVARELRDLLWSWHQDLPPEIRLEEMFHLSQRLPEVFKDIDEKDPRDPRHPKILRTRMEQVLVAIDSADAHEGVPPGVAAWFCSLQGRIPKETWTGPGLGRLLRRAFVAVHKKDALRKAPFVPGPEELQIIHRGKAFVPKRWRVWQVGEQLRMLPIEPALRVPRPSLGAAAAGSPVAEIVASEPVARVGGTGREGVEDELAPDGVPVAILDRADTILLKTDCQELRLEAFDKPGWARRVGRDGYGLWAEFEHKGVAQRMRWIPPGRFLMGSPEDESGRFDNELQHEVELTQGYWLADTACTQELWTIVMGGNPSGFTGRRLGASSRPVEQVSWYDCREFLDRLNRDLPGLAARLPTEAEWENACRAGTTTPFSFGTCITTAQVNCDGRFPYAKATQSAYREETVPVKSLSANPWGLSEMHGNVWEWCLDWYAPYESGMTVDPLRVQETESGCVVRGGSWHDHAKSTRSALRFSLTPVFRDHGVGFRIAQNAAASHNPDVEVERRSQIDRSSGAQERKR
jgi:formylglycine-generating enzyme required for sulfatase activity